MSDVSPREVPGVIKGCQLVFMKAAMSIADRMKDEFGNRKACDHFNASVGFDFV